MKWFFFKLGIVVSVLWWGLTAYVYSHPGIVVGAMPESDAIMAGLVPMSIGALVSVVFSF